MGEKVQGEKVALDHGSWSKFTLDRLDHLNLQSQDTKVVAVTGNEQVEKKLTDLANYYSRVISDKNLTIQN